MQIANHFPGFTFTPQPSKRLTPFKQPPQAEVSRLVGEVIRPGRDRRFEGLEPGPVLFIHAHPDDDMLTAATAAWLEKSGYPVQTLYVTNGNAGKVLKGNERVFPEDVDAFSRKREQELVVALQTMGIRRPPVLLGYDDNEFRGPLPGEAHKIREDLETVIARVKPRLIITFGPDGITNHPYHKAVGNLADQAARKLSPELPAPVEVFHVAMSETAMAAFNQSLMETAKESWEHMRSVPDSKIAVRTDLPPVMRARRMNAMKAYDTQFTRTEMSVFRNYLARYPHEEFTRLNLNA
jgi:LmbE family N-acetylglucosaminyl deacetylase